MPNPSAIFLSGGSTPQPGSCVMVTREGTRPLLVEVQALVDASPLSNPRRVAVGLEQNRLAMLLAVLHRHGGVGVGDQDVFVNVVGGIRLQETAADLPVLLAVLSSLRDRPLADKTVAFGEVGLSGEIRPVPNGEERLREAATHGFKRAIVPKANAPKTGALQGAGSDRGGAPVRCVGSCGLTATRPRAPLSATSQCGSKRLVPAWSASVSPIGIRMSGAMPSISLLPSSRKRAQLGIHTSTGTTLSRVGLPPLT